MLDRLNSQRGPGADGVIMNMQVSIKLIVLAALIGGGIGSATTYVFFPKTDPELKALIEEQVKIARKEQAEKEAAEKAMKNFFGN